MPKPTFKEAVAFATNEVEHRRILNALKQWLVSQEIPETYWTALLSQAAGESIHASYHQNQDLEYFRLSIRISQTMIASFAKRCPDVP
jgi:hypothetical protein